MALAALLFFAKSISSILIKLSQRNLVWQQFATEVGWDFDPGTIWDRYSNPTLQGTVGKRKATWLLTRRKCLDDLREAKKRCSTSKKGRQEILTPLQ